MFKSGTALVLLTLCSPAARAFTCFAAPIAPGQIVGAPTEPTSRLIFLVPQRPDEVGKLSIWVGNRTQAETVSFYTEGEPVEYQLEGDQGSFYGSDHGRELNLTVRGIFAVNSRRDVFVSPSRGVTKYQLQMLTHAECTALYPGSNKIEFE